MDRAEFAKILNSIYIPEWIPQEEIDGLLSPIAEALKQMMPERLFRFRAFDKENKSIGAFKDGLIYALTADKFNDPYDTLARYDMEELKKGVNASMSCDALMQLKNWLEQGNDFPEFLKQWLPSEMIEAFRNKLLSIEDVKSMGKRIEDYKSAMISSMDALFPFISEVGKKFSTIACFCENVQDILMWSHYADSHRGFALEYNFNTFLKHHLNNVGIFPVIYDDERPDVSSFIVWAFLSLMGIKAKNPDTLSSIKFSLFKSSVWEYEKEWRLINYTPRKIFEQESTAIPFEPVAIYYGRYITPEHKQQLHVIAQEKGIKEYEMFVDYSSPVYEMRFRPAEISG